MHRRARTLALTVTLSGLAGALVLAGPAMASPVSPSGTGTTSPSASAAVSDAFCAARLDGAGGRVYGTLPGAVDAKAIIDRALPQ